MCEKVIFKIIDKEAAKLVQVALLLGENTHDCAELLNEIFEESLRQLWRKSK